MQESKSSDDEENSVAMKDSTESTKDDTEANESSEKKTDSVKVEKWNVSE